MTYWGLRKTMKTKIEKIKIYMFVKGYMKAIKDVNVLIEKMLEGEITIERLKEIMLELTKAMNDA